MTQKEHYCPEIQHQDGRTVQLRHREVVSRRSVPRSKPDSMAPASLANRATSGASTCQQTVGRAGWGACWAPGRLTRLRVSCPALAEPAVAPEVPPPAPVVHQAQHISSTTSVKFASVQAPQGEFTNQLMVSYKHAMHACMYSKLLAASCCGWNGHTAASCSGVWNSWHMAVGA